MQRADARARDMDLDAAILLNTSALLSLAAAVVMLAGDASQVR
jgi:hypothetical protein